MEHIQDQYAIALHAINNDAIWQHELLASDERTPQRLLTAPSFATQWLLPRLAGFVRDHPNIDPRFSASTDYARFDDDFDLDIVYGEPKPLPHERFRSRSKAWRRCVRRRSPSASASRKICITCR